MKALRLCVLLDSRLESHKEEEGEIVNSKVVRRILKLPDGSPVYDARHLQRLEFWQILEAVEGDLSGSGGAPVLLPTLVQVPI